MPPQPMVPGGYDAPRVPQPGFAQQAEPTYYGQPATPTWGEAQPQAPWDTPPQTSPYGTYAAPYSQPQYPQYGQQFGALRPAGKSTLGVVALIAGLIATVGSTLVAAFTGGPAARAIVEYQDQYGPLDSSSISDIDLSYFSDVRTSVLGLEISLWLGTIAGILAIVLGIVAIAQRKGRPLGIVALILGIIGPMVWAVGVAIAAVTAGATIS